MYFHLCKNVFMTAWKLQDIFRMAGTYLKYKLCGILHLIEGRVPKAKPEFIMVQRASLFNFLAIFFRVTLSLDSY